MFYGRPRSDYYRWAAELDLNKFYATRLPLVTKEFRHYSEELHPFVDVEALLHLCSTRVTDPERQRKLRAAYTRMIKANGGTYVSWQTFRRKTRIR